MEKFAITELTDQELDQVAGAGLAVDASVAVPAVAKGIAGDGSVVRAG